MTPSADNDSLSHFISANLIIMSKFANVETALLIIAKLIIIAVAAIQTTNCS